MPLPSLAALGGSPKPGHLRWHAKDSFPLPIDLHLTLTRHGGTTLWKPGVFACPNSSEAGHRRRDIGVEWHCGGERGCDVRRKARRGIVAAVVASSEAGPSSSPLKACSVSQTTSTILPNKITLSLIHQYALHHFLDHRSRGVPPGQRRSRRPLPQRTGNVTTRDLDLWAQFCNDKACSEGCGISVAVSNPGCLNENGRQSIMFHGATSELKRFALVVSPSENRPCQDTCRVLSDTQCMDISAFGGQDQSFRFNGASQGGGTCDANNC
ncbi:hypothetical protein C8J57DRAFT_1723813 [Mycena rebaudengoi]|nr:hypothetical protein C8J57DRAFT_1723813 [Mycena rebaudengoi]